MKNVMFVGVLVEILEFNRKMKTNENVKHHITNITPILQDFVDFFSKSLAFNMFFTLMLVEVKLNGI